MLLVSIALAAPVDLAKCEDKSDSYEGANRVFACGPVQLKIVSSTKPSLDFHLAIAANTAFAGREVRWETVRELETHGERTRHFIATPVEEGRSMHVIVDLPAAEGTVYTCIEADGHAACEALVTAVSQDPSLVPPLPKAEPGDLVIAGRRLVVDPACVLELDGEAGTVRCQDATLSWDVLPEPAAPLKPKLLSVFGDRARFTECTSSLPDPAWCTRLELDDTPNRIWIASGAHDGRGWWIRCTDHGRPDPLCRQLADGP
ncbi:MAG: hypothetical protein H6737_22255 [Alphaproteobacteria bacterium]|nr:hypothetical protein [Alphaproteobacteria bacterium]